MTKTEIAANAIRGIKLSRSAHIEIMETLRYLKVTTLEAVEIRKVIVADWTAADWDSDAREVLGLAKTVINSYARDVSYR